MRLEVLILRKVSFNFFWRLKNLPADKNHPDLIKNLVAGLQLRRQSYQKPMFYLHLRNL